MKRFTSGLMLILTLGLGACAMLADQGEHHSVLASMSGVSADKHAHSAAPDTRQMVSYPDAMRQHTLASMRDHLKTLSEIQIALASGAFDRASDLAEQRLGMSALGMHGAHEAAPFMPQGMQDAGTAMHRTASQFALVAKDASVSGDLQPVLSSLGKLSQTCVACHAAYRLQ